LGKNQFSVESEVEPQQIRVRLQIGHGWSRPGVAQLIDGTDDDWDDLHLIPRHQLDAIERLV
jgi:hypothetical protein